MWASEQFLSSIYSDNHRPQLVYRFQAKGELPVPQNTHRFFRRAVNKNVRSHISPRIDMAKTNSRDIEAPGPEGALAGTLLLPSIGETP